MSGLNPHHHRSVSSTNNDTAATNLIGSSDSINHIAQQVDGLATDIINTSLPSPAVFDQQSIDIRQVLERLPPGSCTNPNVMAAIQLLAGQSLSGSAHVNPSHTSLPQPHSDSQSTRASVQPSSHAPVNEASTASAKGEHSSTSTTTISEFAARSDSSNHHHHHLEGSSSSPVLVARVGVELDGTIDSQLEYNSNASGSTVSESFSPDGISHHVVNTPNLQKRRRIVTGESVSAESSDEYEPTPKKARRLSCAPQAPVTVFIPGLGVPSLPEPTSEMTVSERAEINHLKTQMIVLQLKLSDDETAMNNAKEEFNGCSANFQSVSSQLSDLELLWENERSQFAKERADNEAERKRAIAAAEDKFARTEESIRAREATLRADETTKTIVAVGLRQYHEGKVNDLGATLLDLEFKIKRSRREYDDAVARLRQLDPDAVEGWLSGIKSLKEN